MQAKIWRMEIGDGPIVAAAVHAGGALRPEVAARMALAAAERRREEDPHTDEWTTLAANRLIGLFSRFEVDLNRPRESAVYRRPEDAWGLEVWHQEPPPELVERSLAAYDAFYREAHQLLSRVAERHGRFVVYDLHSYNHRRDGAGAEPADPEANPQVNVGTRSVDRELWGPLVDRFVADLAAQPFPGGLDVRENVKFGGGNFPRWVNANFPGTGCAIAIELKKFFMDEWSGDADRPLVAAIGSALAATVPGVLEELSRL